MQLSLARALVVGAVVALCAPLLAQLPAGAQLTAVAAVQPVPATRVFKAPIEPYADYLGQTLCSPTAKSGLVKLAALLQITYGPHDIGITRPCTDGGQSEHKEGRALDWMITASQRPQAQAFLTWLLAPDKFGNPAAMARRLGVMYIGWDNQMWRAYDPSIGWTDLKTCSTNPAMKAPAYDTYCHRNHIHISFSWDGAQGTTSFWTGNAILVPDCARRTAAVNSPTAGTLSAPVVLLDTATGAGTQAKVACRLGAERWAGDDRTLRVHVPVPTAPAGKRYELRVRVDRYLSNAPGTLYLDTAASTAVGVRAPATTWDLPIGTDGVVAVSVNAGQAYVRLSALGLVLITAPGAPPPVSAPPTPAVSLSMPAQVVAAQTLTLSGTVANAPAGALVRRFLLVDGSWETRGTPAPLDESSWTMSAAAPSTPETLTYKIALTSSSGVTLAWSPQRSVTVVAAVGTATAMRASARPEIVRAFYTSTSYVVGKLLRASKGVWQVPPTSYTYLWFRDGRSIPKADNSWYVPASADRGVGLSVRVTAARPGARSTAAFSRTVRIAR